MVFLKRAFVDGLTYAGVTSHAVLEAFRGAKRAPLLWDAMDSAPRRRRARENRRSRRRMKRLRRRRRRGGSSRGHGEEEHPPPSSLSELPFRLGLALTADRPTLVVPQSSLGDAALVVDVARIDVTNTCATRAADLAGKWVATTRVCMCVGVCFCAAAIPRLTVPSHPCVLQWTKRLSLRWPERT